MKESGKSDIQREIERLNQMGQEFDAKVAPKRWEASAELTAQIQNSDRRTGERLLKEAMEAEIPEFMELLASVDAKLDRVQELAKDARDQSEYHRSHGAYWPGDSAAAKVAAYEDVLRIFNRTPKG